MIKTELTIEQSQHLIELGVPSPNSEISIHRSFPHHKLVDTYKVFKLEDLLEILNSIEDTELSMHHWMDDSVDVWTAEIVEFCDAYSHSDSLIDALYELTVFCLENSYLKFE